MKLIVGLGNPGREYEENRHNIGFTAISSFAHEKNIDFKLWNKGAPAEIAQIKIKDEQCFLLMPLTFMNNSGQAVVAAANFYKILPQDICVIHDDLDLPFGDVRLKQGGGDGGHNGLKSITQSLSTSDYSRIRIGIGRPPHPSMETADYVLGNFSEDQSADVDSMIEKSIEGINAFFDGEQKFKNLMNSFNQKKLERN